MPVPTARPEKFQFHQQKCPVYRLMQGDLVQSTPITHCFSPSGEKFSIRGIRLARARPSCGNVMLKKEKKE